MPLIEAPKPRVMLPSGVSTLHHQPPHPPVPRPPHPTDPRLLTGLTDPRSQPHPGGESLVAAEPVYRDYLRQDEHRGEGAHPRHGHQQPYPGVIHGEGRELLLDVADLLVQDHQQCEVAAEDGVVHESKALLPHPSDGLLAELGLVWDAQPLLVEEGVNPVPHGGPVLHQPQPVAEELPSAPVLLAGDEAGGEHARPVQPGEGPGVGPVRLHPGLGDEMAVGGARESYVEAVFLEPVVDLDPQIPRGLHHRSYLIPVSRESLGELLYALRGVHEPGLVKQLTFIVEDGHLTHLFMHIYSHILHGCHLLGGLRAARSYGVSVDHSGSRSDSAQSG